ncbi:MAG: hypothetical protein KGQ66_18625 [Acidobacteriota bacterium]|nr:hypothetical protein [Acidobacteriota bacterium]
MRANPVRTVPRCSPGWRSWLAWSLSLMVVVALGVRPPPPAEAYASLAVASCATPAAVSPVAGSTSAAACYSITPLVAHLRATPPGGGSSPWPTTTSRLFAAVLGTPVQPGPDALHQRVGSGRSSCRGPPGVIPA